ncbi:hypothetical protein OKE76_11575 [Riemerella anatipestifer]|nr:hypothetical protein [Riemerella anatipestifer]MCW0512187.1 hypothetical protein [Riemerella anatipestifer]
MHNGFPIIFFFFLFLFSCNSQIKKNSLASLLVKFNKDDFNKNIFNKIYFLDGVYQTRNNFELIYPKLEEHKDIEYIDFMKIQDDGKIAFGTMPSRKDYFKNYNRIENDNYNAIIAKEKGHIHIYRNVILHTILGMGGGSKIKKQSVFIDNKNYIYIQDGNKCFVYKSLN